MPAKAIGIFLIGVLVAAFAAVAALADAMQGTPATAASTTRWLTAQLGSGHFLAGLVAGVVAGEIARVLWQLCTSTWSAVLTLGAFAVRYAAIGAALLAIVYFV